MKRVTSTALTLLVGVLPIITILVISGCYTQPVSDDKVGAYLETPFTSKGNPESALGNLLTDILLESLDGDIAIHNVSGGIRAPLPAGELTYGSLYEMFPFDYRVVVLEISGRDLRNVIAAEARKSRRRAGFSGMRVSVRCDDGMMRIEMTRTNGDPIRDADTVSVITNDYLALGGDAILSPAMPAGGFVFDSDMPLTRDLIVNWFRDRGAIRADDFLTGDQPKWRTPAEIPESCKL